MKKGFTLLEVLIALAVLSISMMGIYRLSSMSVDMSEYSKSRTMVIELGYQRVLESLNYPGKIFRKNAPNALNIKAEYETDSTPAMFPGVNEMTLKTTYEGVSSTYVYYEQE